METGFRGTFVISWHQTDVDGQKATTRECLTTGATWRWSGNEVRVDGPADILRLGQAEGMADLRKRAARAVRRLVGAALTPLNDNDPPEPEERDQDSGFIVTDGRKTYTITVIEMADGSAPLLMMFDGLPPKDVDLWVVQHALKQRKDSGEVKANGGVICFAGGTWLETPDGRCQVENIEEGDWVMTRDSGAQQVLWAGRRHMSGARLYVMPQLRPIRIRKGALELGEPDEDLIISPDHRVLIKGRKARLLFNTPEVLVAAKNLINDHSITIDTALREVTYHHLLLDQHHVVRANGVDTESFHPAATTLGAIAEDQRAALVERVEGVETDPWVYGDFARRLLTSSEAEILRHNVA